MLKYLKQWFDLLTFISSHHSFTITFPLDFVVPFYTYFGKLDNELFIAILPNGTIEH